MRIVEQELAHLDRRGQRASRSKRLMTCIVVSFACSLALLWICGSALAASSEHVAAASSAASTKGLAPGASLPSWAASERVHFFASAPTLLGGLPAQGLGARPQVHRNLGRRCTEEYCPLPPLLYHVGSGVQHSPVVHVIFWGSNWNSSPGSELKTQLLKMYEGLSGSNWQGILTQYFDTTGRISSTLTVSSYIDTGVSAPTSVNDAKIKEEVSKALEANHTWSRTFSSQFVVIPAPGATYASGFDTGFCGYHGVDASGSSYTFVAYAGEAPFKSGCLAFDPTENADHVTSMIASHEYAESATDPQVEPAANAEWYTGNLYEIGDICASGDSELPNGTWVQGLWDDHQGECSISDAAPPHVYAVTEHAKPVKLHEATLQGVVNPESSETKYYFEYGPTTSYGTKTAEVSAGSGIANREASQAITGLTLEATYHYRVAAVNATGTTYGEDQTLTTTRWSVQATPNPPGSNGGELRGVSCTTSTACIAVSSYHVESENTWWPFAEKWNGTEWSLLTTAKPTGATAAEMGAVSCTSSTACIAVGRYKNSAGTYVTLAEHWNGTEWSAQTTPNPVGATASALGAISCSSSTSCIAVGSSTVSGSASALAESWNGTEWSLQTTPSVTHAQLRRVSCSSSTACTVVGSYENSSHVEVTLAERWNGTEWSTQTTPNPSGAKRSYLFGVSCLSSTECTAVGYYVNSSNVEETLAERWSGTEWSVQTTPNVTGAKENRLYGVACISSTECVGVGLSTNSTLESETGSLIERWKGTEWVIEPNVYLGNPLELPGAELASISCVSAEGICTAVGWHIGYKEGGYGYAVPLAERRTSERPVNTVPPVVSLTTPDQNVPETTTNGTWENSPTSYSYQWERCNATGGECANITGATGATYTPVAADVEHTLIAKVTATNSAGSNSAHSTATGKVKPTGEITEYALPAGSEPEGIAAGPDGKLWFTDRATHKVGKITTSGTVSEYALPEGSHPMGITAGPDGDVWFADSGTSKIGKVTTGGEVTEYPLPAGNEPFGIVAGSDGNLWFTESGTSKIGKITTSGTITEYSLPANSFPQYITAGPGGLWFTDLDTDKVGKITTSGTITEYPLSTGNEPEGIAAGPDGNLWLTVKGFKKVDKMTTSGTVTEYTTTSEPVPGIAAGADGNLWFEGWSSNKVGKITTSGESTEYSLPTGSRPEQIASGPDNNLWFVDASSSKIGKIVP